MRNLTKTTRVLLCTFVVGAAMVLAGGCEVDVTVDRYGWYDDEYEIEYAIERIVYGVFDIVEWFDD